MENKDELKKDFQIEIDKYENNEIDFDEFFNWFCETIINQNGKIPDLNFPENTLSEARI